jgi:hypothetical protein
LVFAFSPRIQKSRNNCNLLVCHLPPCRASVLSVLAATGVRRPLPSVAYVLARPSRVLAELQAAQDSKPAAHGEIPRPLVFFWFFGKPQ